MTNQNIESIRNDARKEAGLRPGEDIYSDPKKMQKCQRLVAKKVSQIKDPERREYLQSQLSPEEKREYARYSNYFGAPLSNSEGPSDSSNRSWADDWKTGVSPFDSQYSSSEEPQEEDSDREENPEENNDDPEDNSEEENNDDPKNESSENNNDNESPESQSSEDQGQDESPNEEPRIGEARDNSGKPLNKDPHSGSSPAEKMPKKLPGGGGAAGGEAAAAAGGEAAAAASAAAAEGAAAGAAATSEIWLPILAVIFIFLVVVFFFTSIASNYGSPEDKSTGTAVICLDAGHPPNGASGEPKINLIVAKEVQTELELRGYTVIMTRTNEDAVSISERPQKCKSAADSKGGADLFYSFHADGTPRSAGYPYQIYPKSSRSSIYTKSKKMAVIIQEEVAKSINGVSDLKDGGTCAEGSCTMLDSLGVFSGSEGYGIPAVLTEMTQLTNGGSTLDNDSNRKKLVIGIANGIEAAVPKEINEESPSGNKIIDEAKKHIGKPYLWGGSGPNSFDCSGLTKYVYKKAANIVLPRNSSSQYSEAKIKISRKSDLKPGDLVFFGNNSIHHVGIYIGKDTTREGELVNDAYIHSPQTGDTVKISSLSSRNDFFGGGRYE